MMKKMTTGLAVMLGTMALLAEPPSFHGGREVFMKQQAYAEAQRLSGQFDVLESNQAALAERVRRLEQGGGEIASLKADLQALRADLNRLRAEMESQRREIVNDLLKRIDENERKRQRVTPPAPPPTTVPEVRGQYVVQPGDTLSLIAQAFGTTVSRIKEMNKLQSDALRVGQKLMVPDPSARRR